MYANTRIAISLLKTVKHHHYFQELPDPSIEDQSVPVNLTIPVGLREQILEMLNAIVNGRIQQEEPEPEDEDEVDR